MFATDAKSNSLEKTVDWAVFAVGAVALGTAIVATALPAVDAQFAQAETLVVAEQPAS